MRPIAIILLFLVFVGCKKVQNLKAPDAFFVQPQNTAVAVTTTTLQGTTSHKITDYWYYVNEQFKGAFPTGNMFPVPSTGPTQILIYAGIKNNGISTTRLPYEFYEPITFDTSVVPGTIVKRDFTFKYKSGTKFHLLEGFEGWGSTTGITLANSINSDVIFSILDLNNNPSADVFEGTKCLYYAMNSDSAIAQFETTSDFPLPKSGAPVYLEMNYKCTQPFNVGVFAGSSFQYAASVNTSTTWNKIYISLGTGVSTLLTSSKVKLYIASIYDQKAPKQEVWIDNIKIISY